MKTRTRLETAEKEIERLSNVLRHRASKAAQERHAQSADATETAPPAEPPAADSMWADEKNADIWADELPAPASIPSPTIPPAPRTPKPVIHMAAPTAAPVKTQRAQKPHDADDFEFRFGKSLPVWVGGIALALAGFYLVKYSIENGLLTASVRVALGFLFGLALLGAGGFIRNKRPHMADALRISQALTGAGIAVIYGTFFAATRFYGMPRSIGFGGMAGMTVLAVVLSLRHGLPIAALGMLGGFATPALLSNGTHEAAPLFIYLFLLCAGLFALVRARNWWILAVPALILSFFWTFGWILSGNVAAGGIWPALFLLCIGCTAFVVPQQHSNNAPAAQNDAQDWGLISGYIATGGAVALMALLTVKSGFGLMDWGMYGLLGAGTLALSWFKPAQYRYAPWLSMGITAFMLLSWHAQDGVMAATILGFGALYALGGAFFLSRTPSIEHAGTVAAATLGFYGLGYFCTGGHIYDIASAATLGTVRWPHQQTAQAAQSFIAGPHFWSGLAIALAVAFTFMTSRVFVRTDIETVLREKLSALFAVMASAFVFIALTLEAHKGFLPTATALELAAVCWIYTRIDIAFLRKIAAALFYVFCLLMVPQAFHLLGGVLDVLVGGNGREMDVARMAQTPLFYVLLPAAAFGLSSWLLNRRHDGKLPETLEAASVALGALGGYFLLRNALGPQLKTEPFEANGLVRGFASSLFFALALCSVYGGRLFARRALLWSGSALFGLALLRTGYFEYVLYNPLFNDTPALGGLVFNSLAVAYGLPLFWLWLEERPALRIYVAPTAKGAAVLLLIFTLVTLNVRHAFHGADLTLGQPMSNAEIYSYSAAWLLLSAGMLFLGTLRRHKPLRVAALAVMMLTACKVFLYDAGELEGLYRVFAFMGLGLTLLGLSWFYTRFVLNDAPAQPAPEK